MVAGKPQDSSQGPSLDAVNATTRSYFQHLGKRIAQLRMQHDMTQAELARLLGVSQQSVFSYELGDRRVRLDLVPALTKTFGISSDELLGIRPLPLPTSQDHIPAKLLRHIGIINRLKSADQRFILRLAETMFSVL